MIDGTRQNQRSLDALETRRFPVDGMPLEQLVSLCRGLSERLRFIDLNNHEAGTWQGLFDGDESLVLAAVASFDHESWRQDFMRICDTRPLPQMLVAVLQMAQQLDGWHQGLGGTSLAPVVAVRDAIAQVVQRQVGEPLAVLVRHLAADAGAGNSLRDLYASLQTSLWPALAEAERLAEADGASTASRRARSARATPQGLRGLGMSLLHGVQRVQALARARLADTLDTGTHEPAAGLLLAFLRLYGRVQEQVNGFSARHIDFYYRRVLGLGEQPAQPDRVHLVCLPDPRRSGGLVVPAGTLFNAGKDTGGQPLQFRALQDLAVGDARVTALATLLQQRDDKITPEEAMAYVTGVRARGPWLPDADADPVPLFGGGPGSREGRLGLAIASPLLDLREGERVIDLELRLAWPQPAEAMLATLVARAQAAAQDASLKPAERALQFRHALGEVFACWLLGPEVDLEAQQRDTLRRCADELGVSLGDAPPPQEKTGLDPPSLLRMCNGEPDARRRVFFRHIDDLFDISLTHAEGWLAAERIQFGLPRVGSSGGLHLRIFLRPDDPPITGCDPKVHGAAWPTRLPVLSLQVSPRAGIHPASLFESARFVQAELAVEVRGVRQLVLQNQLGPLDPQKPFAPFGPLPTTSSYLLLGSPEAAGKTLDAMQLTLRWAGLPDDPDGWAGYYEGYGPEQTDGDFTVALSLLRGGIWHPCTGRSAEQPLFDLPPGVERPIPATQTIEVDSRSVREFAGTSGTLLDGTYGARDGLLRLQLKGPRGAFGHSAYAELLGQAVRSRAWRRGVAVMPRLPYTPELESITMDYEAHTVLAPLRDASTSGAGDSDSERLLHLQPFGVTDMQPDPLRRHHTLLPALGPDGGLYIGIEAQELQGPLTLLFQLRPSGAAELPDDEEPERLRWDVLQNDQWRPLSLRETSDDTTCGMLTTGIVTLDLPAGLSRRNRYFGDERYWLRVSRSRLLDTVSPLVSVHAQALQLERVLKPSDSTPLPLPPGSIKGPEVPVPGLAGVMQVEASSGLRPAEDGRQLRTRAGERLRHKNRASLVWDYERLVLEHFPEVYKVRCFAWHEVGHYLDRLDPQDAPPRPPPGTVLIAVVPHVRRNDAASSTLAPRLDTLALQRIRQMLAAHVSPSVRLEVRNAHFERVQARCTLRLDPTAQPGEVRRRVNAAITEYLSPWFDAGLGPQFDWTLRCEDVETVVRNVWGVNEVAALSLLHVTNSSGSRYRLGDTAASQRREGGRVLHRRRPWSLALPLSEHLIDIVSRQEPVSMAAEVSGVRQLRIGQTFVVGEREAP